MLGWAYFVQYQLLICLTITASRKPKVHNVSQRRQKRNEPRPRGQQAKHLRSSALRFSRHVSGYTQTHTRTQIDMIITIRRTSPGEVMI